MQACSWNDIDGQYPKRLIFRISHCSAPSSSLFLCQHIGQFLWFVYKLPFYQPNNCQTDQPVRKQLCSSTGKKGSFSVEGSKLLSWLRLGLVLSSENKETAAVLPVFSQPSSSLRSEQSSSPSHLHDKRTQRPVPQRNWSAVHMDVAAGRMHPHMHKHTHARTLSGCVQFSS